MAPHADNNNNDGYELSAPDGAMDNNHKNPASAANQGRRGGHGISASAGRLFSSIRSLHDEQEEAPTWDVLNETERHRREILQRVESPFWRILLHWNGTCLRSLLLDYMVWIPMLIFAYIRFDARSGGEAPGVIEQLQDSNVDILGGFLSFLLVIFVNQTNARFFAMYQLSKAAAGRIQDVAGLVATRFPQPAAHRLVRYLNAAHVAGYVGLGGPYTQQHFFDHFNEQDHLLMPADLVRLENVNMDAGSATFKELVTWCQRQAHKAHKQGLIDTIETAELDDKILAFRAAMDGIYDYCDQPVHFFYVHFLCLLSVLYLPLFAMDNAYSAGWGGDEDVDWLKELLMGTIVFVQAIFVVGLRMLGQKMIDPYGDDWEDLSVITYIKTTIENCRIILKAGREQQGSDDDGNDDAAEEELIKAADRRLEQEAAASDTKQVV